MMELRGLPVANAISERLKNRIENLKNNSVIPKLTVVRIGNNEDDKSYENGIIKKFTELNAAVDIIELPIDISQDKFEIIITSLNNDDTVHGILIFKPLPKHLSDERIKYIINTDKDVDCIGLSNLASLFSGDNNSYPPCTAQAVMELLDYYKIDLTGKKVVVVGRSLVVGKPLSMLMLNKNATVTICHTKTKNLADDCKNADILISCVGKAKMITKAYTNPSQIVIDVGINFENGKLCGDVNYEEVADNVEAITPVPGGVGTVTTSVLLKHTVISAERLSVTCANQLEPNELLTIISNEYQDILKENLCGIYIHGSLAFGCFNWDKSDIDFLVVVYQAIQQSQKEDLISTLIRLNKYAPSKGFEMSVVLYCDCKDFCYPTPFQLHFSNAHIKRAGENLSEYCRTMNGVDCDLAAHFTVVNKVGIALYGKPVTDVFGEVSPKYYLDSIRADIENAESEIESNPIYIILNLCRVLAFIKYGLVLSKEQGGKWGITNLPDEFLEIIKKARDCYTSDKEYVSDADIEKHFARYMKNEIFN